MGQGVVAPHAELAALEHAQHEAVWGSSVNPDTALVYCCILLADLTEHLFVSSALIDLL